MTARLSIDPDQLRELAAKKTPTPVLAEQFGCTQKTIRMRLRELGVPRKRGQKTMCRNGHDLTLPGARGSYGRCRVCRRNISRAIRAKAGGSDRPKGEWVKIDLAQVTAMRDQGLTLKQIAAQLGLAYGTLTKRTAKAGINFSRGMTPERWEQRRLALARHSAERDLVREHEQARRQHLWTVYLDAAVEEETLPPYLRGKAALLKAEMQGEIQKPKEER